MPLTEYQQMYLRHCNHRWNVKTGATGSGKSWIDYAVTIPKRIMACRGEGLIVLIGNTQGTLERNILDPMRNIWGDVLVGTISSKNTVQLFGKKCYAIGADKKNQVAKIQGATMEYVYGDEVTTWSVDVFQMLKSRLRCEHSRFDGTCNPDSPLHWFKQFLDSDADIYQQSYTIDDGCLPENIVSELKKEYAGTVYYARYILGLWCIDGGTAYRTAEYYYNGREERQQKTDEEYYSALDKLAGGRTIQAIVIDPSAASFIETIRRHGKYRVNKANNAVLDGIRVTNSLLNAERIRIHESCADIIREFSAYSWDDKKQEDAVIKENDHAMDDMRYFCMTILHKKFRW